MTDGKQTEPRHTDSFTQSPYLNWRWGWGSRQESQKASLKKVVVRGRRVRTWLASEPKRWWCKIKKIYDKGHKDHIKNNDLQNRLLWWNCTSQILLRLIRLLRYIWFRKEIRPLEVLGVGIKRQRSELFYFPASGRLSAPTQCLVMDLSAYTWNNSAPILPTLPIWYRLPHGPH